MVFHWIAGGWAALKLKISPENANEDDLAYFDASTYGTNDKEKRIRRHKLLIKYLEEIIDK